MATESFFSNASLAYLASAGAGKDGKTYSIKPTDGTGDFTFSRGSNLAATRVGADGLIEKGRENLLLQSNQFDSVSWSGLSKTSGILGYDGTNDAWEITKPAQPYTPISQSVSATGVWTFSLYAKANTLDKISIRNQTDGEKADIDLLNGLITYTSSGIVHSDIELISNDWYRLQITFSGSTAQIAIYVAWNNSTAGSVYIQDAQLEIGLAATDVISTGATTGKAGLLEDEPRFDYSGGATCPSLLLEPSRTNLVQSEYFGAYTNGNSTDEPNATTSPEGLINATSFLESATTGQHKLVTSLGLDGSSTYTFSIFAKHNGRDLYIDTGNSNEWGGRAWFDLTAGTANAFVGTADIEDFGNGWYRCIVTGASTLAGGNQIELLTSDGATNSTTGDITKGVYIYGAQFEVGSYATSYIPNHSGGSVTRGADAASVTGVSSLIGQTEGTLFVEVDFQQINAGGYRVFAYIYNNSDPIANSVRIQMEPTNKVWAVLNSSDVQTFLIESNGQDAGNLKMAFAYKSGDSVFYINGLQVGTSSSTFSFSANLDSPSLVYHTGGNQSGNGVKKSLLFKERLSNTDLATLTTI